MDLDDSNLANSDFSTDSSDAVRVSGGFRGINTYFSPQDLRTGPPQLRIFITLVMYSVLPLIISFFLFFKFNTVSSI